jgi:hypothetical protein
VGGKSTNIARTTTLYVRIKLRTPHSIEGNPTFDLEQCMASLTKASLVTAWIFYYELLNYELLSISFELHCKLYTFGITL